MAIGYASVGTKATKGSASSIAVTLTATVPIGGILAVCVVDSNSSIQGSGNVSTVTDTKSNVYTQAVFVASGSTFVPDISIWFSVLTQQLTTTDSVTITFKAAESVQAVSLISISGLASAVLDRTSSNSSAGTASTSLDSNSTTTTTAGTEALIGLGGVNGPSGDTFTPGTTNAGTWSALGRVGTSGGGATSNWTCNPMTLSQSATNFEDANATITSRNWSACIATFKTLVAVTALPAPPQILRQAVTRASVF